MNRKLIVLLIAIALFTLVDIALFLRYASWGSGVQELIPFMIFLVLAEALILYSVYELEDIINPFTIYSVFIYIAGFSFISVSDRQQPYTWQFILILSLSVTCFLAGGFVALKTSKFSLRNLLPTLQPSLALYFLFAVFSIGILVFISEIRQLGYIPLLNLGNTNLYDELNENETTPLHNFIVLNAILPAMWYTLHKKGVLKFWMFLLLSAGSTFIIVNFFSRQIIVLFFFSMLIAVMYFKKISLVKLTSIGAGCIVLFIVLGELRSSQSDEVDAKSINNLLKEFAGITKPTNLLETYLSLYGAVNFSTGSRLTNEAAKDGYIRYGAYSFKPIIAIFPINNEKVYPIQYSGYTQLGTYLVEPYMDFRWAGVILLNFMYGLFSMNSFKNYRSKISPYYIVEWALFIFCIFMCSFTNYFHLFFVLFFFLVNRFAFK
jgi:oligosaccharide repeat unit polymerase